MDVNLGGVGTRFNPEKYPRKETSQGLTLVGYLGGMGVWAIFVCVHIINCFGVISVKIKHYLSVRKRQINNR